MSDSGIVYCLICFILGWLISRMMMENGFQVGGQTGCLPPGEKCFTGGDCCLPDGATCETGMCPLIVGGFELTDKYMVPDENYHNGVSWPIIEKLLKKDPTGNGLIPEANYVHISKWDTSKVTTMNSLFYQHEGFDADISKWDTSNVTDMNSMFEAAYSFSADIWDWKVQNVTDMGSMFWGADFFNSNLSFWKPRKCTNMSHMFEDCGSFNREISQWPTGQVTNMSNMFANTSYFNCDISPWDTSKVTDMSGMFYQAKAFNQDLSGWFATVKNVVSFASMFEGSILSRGNALKLRMWIINCNKKPHAIVTYMFKDSPIFNEEINRWEGSRYEKFFDPDGNLLEGCNWFNGKNCFLGCLPEPKKL